MESDLSINLTDLLDDFLYSFFLQLEILLKKWILFLKKKKLSHTCISISNCNENYLLILGVTDRQAPSKKW